MQVNPYLHFDGQCKQAFEFYADALHGKVVMAMTYGESPMAVQCAAEAKDRMMHMCLALGDVQIMGADSPPGMAKPMEGFSINIGADDPAEAERVFSALAEGGTVRMPLEETFWAYRFGMVVDKFGTPWMVNCVKPMG